MYVKCKIFKPSFRCKCSAYSHLRLGGKIINMLKIEKKLQVGEKNGKNWR